MTQKFHPRFLAAIVWLILHGVEETLTWFAAVDNFYHAIFKPLFSLEIQDSLLIFFQIALACLFLVTYICLFQKRAIWILLYILWAFLFIELHHVIKTFIVGGYYPGTISAVGLNILWFFYRKNLLKQKNTH